jgi:hypothetical protein
MSLISVGRSRNLREDGDDWLMMVELPNIDQEAFCNRGIMMANVEEKRRTASLMLKRFGAPGSKLSWKYDKGVQRNWHKKLLVVDLPLLLVQSKISFK